MRAAVYLGPGHISLESIETPSLAEGEILIRVESCGICHTDLKKIEHNLLPPPRIYGHETAGVVAAVGGRVTKYAAGRSRDRFPPHTLWRLLLLRSPPLCSVCCVKKVGVTAGYEPAGGGFSQYVRAMDWVVNRGVEMIPDGVSFDQACWVEPVNTCLKAVELLALGRGDRVAILGQGPIGLIFTMLAKRLGTDSSRHRYN